LRRCCWLRALDGHAAGVLFTPVDAPGVRPETIEALIGAWRRSAAEVILPRQDGRHGHPVLAGPALVDSLLKLAEGATARDAVHAHRAGTLEVDVDDARIHWDIDTPDEYAALEEEVSE
jgi:CTP:molybdopterin cytidylyltransferase MocA